MFLFLAACTAPGRPEDVFALLDLDRPGLEEVKACCDDG